MQLFHVQMQYAICNFLPIPGDQYIEADERTLDQSLSSNECISITQLGTEQDTDPIL